MAELTNEMKVIKDIFVNIKGPATRLVAVKLVRKHLLTSKPIHSPSIEAVIDKGLVPHLVHFLQDFDNNEIQFEAAWALSNISAGSNEQTKAVIDH